jgi:type VI secretion system secreted protein VgrG
MVIRLEANFSCFAALGSDPESHGVREASIREFLLHETLISVVLSIGPHVSASPASLTSPITLDFTHPPATRSFHGTSIHAAHSYDHAQSPLSSSSPTYDFRCASRLFALDRTRASRLFPPRDLAALRDVRQLAQSLLQAHAIPDGDVRWSLTRDPSPRRWFVQHDESDLTFLTRLLAEEGIAWVIRQEPDRDIIEFFDDTAALPPIAGDPALRYRGVTLFEPDTIDAVRERTRLTSDAALLQDDDPWSPFAAGFDHARASSPSAARSRREVQHHPARFAAPDDGRRLAQRTLEAALMHGRVIEGTSTCLRLEAGKWFRLTDHPRAALNGEYVITEVTHEVERQPDDVGEAWTYRNHFVAVPRGVQVRPAMPSPPPVPRGLQRGVITSLPGEDIHVDPEGRVTARLGWDLTRRDDTLSSPPLRVAHPQVQDSMLLPRVGFEVLVGHEQGDPERPFVSSQLYDAERTPPYPLPDRKAVSALQTATTHGGEGTNELRFDDTAGAEEVFVHASQDHAVEVRRDGAWSAGNNRLEHVTAHRSTEVVGALAHRVGAGRTLDVSGTQTSTVERDADLLVEGDAQDAVTGSRRERVDGAFAEDTAKALDRTVNGSERVVTLREARYEVLEDLTVEAGGAGLSVAGGSSRSEVDGNRSLEVGGLRFVKARQVEQVVGGDLTITGAASKVVCRGERRDTAKGDVTETADGERVLRARRITVEAQQELTLKAGGCTLTLSASGAVEIKGDAVDLADVKTLTQAMHRSN